MCKYRTSLSNSSFYPGKVKLYKHSYATSKMIRSNNGFCGVWVLRLCAETGPLNSLTMWRNDIWRRTIKAGTFTQSMGGFIYTFSLLSSLSFTFQSSKLNYSSSSQWQLKWLSQFRCQFRCQFAVPQKR